MPAVAGPDAVSANSGSDAQNATQRCSNYTVHDFPRIQLRRSARRVVGLDRWDLGPIGRLCQSLDDAVPEEFGNV